MADPQAGILPEPRESAVFLVLRARDGVRDAATLARVAARIPVLTAKLAKSDPPSTPGQRRELRPPALGGRLARQATPRLPRLFGHRGRGA